MTDVVEVPDWIAETQIRHAFVDHDRDAGGSNVTAEVKDGVIVSMTVTAPGNRAYDYEAKGAEDFKAGARDERLYALQEPHGLAYRNGYRRARLAAEASEDAPPSRADAPEPVPADPLPVAASKAPEPTEAPLAEPEAIKQERKPPAPRPKQLDLF